MDRLTSNYGHSAKKRGRMLAYGEPSALFLLANEHGLDRHADRHL